MKKGVRIFMLLIIHHAVVQQKPKSDLTFFSRNYRRQLDHLYYVTDPEKHGGKEDIMCIVEEGFWTAEQYKVGVFCHHYPELKSLNKKKVICQGLVSSPLWN